MKKLIIYGAGSYADAFYYEARRTGQAKIAAFAVNRAYLQGRDTYHALPLVAFEDCDAAYPPAEYDMLVLCGYMKMRDRKRMFENAKEKGYRLPNYISRDACVEDDITMGENNIIFPCTCVGHCGVMGDGNILRQNVYLGHNFHLGNHIIVSPGATVAGTCTIGDLCFIGVGATVLDQKHIGSECLIGAGAVVTKDVDAGTKCFGNPARTISTHMDTGVVF